MSLHPIKALDHVITEYADYLRTEFRAKDLKLAKPATVEEALRAGGLDWRVDEVDLMTADHYRETKGSKVSYALLGDGMDLKIKAFRLIGQYANAV